MHSTFDCSDKADKMPDTITSIDITYRGLPSILNIGIYIFIFHALLISLALQTIFHLEENSACAVQCV